MASSLPEELVQEILVPLPADEPIHLVRASLVCKAWRRVLSDRDCFLRRCREFHGGPPLLGYVQNRYFDTPMRFVPTPASIASPIHMPTVDCNSWWHALDCRHGRVLIHVSNASSNRLIVWDPITSSQQDLSMSPHYPWPYVGAVLCAMDGCDHLDCHGGPFMAVTVQVQGDSNNLSTWPSIYSSKTGAWSIFTPNCIHHRVNYSIVSGNLKHNLLIGDTLYFLIPNSKSIIMFDLKAHRQSKIEMPRDVFRDTLMMAEGGGLGHATLKNNCIYLWSRQDVTNGKDRWVENRVMELRTILVQRRVPIELYKLVGFTEATNTIFFNISGEIIMLDLKSKKVRMVGEIEADRAGPFLPYVSFYAPK